MSDSLSVNNALSLLIHASRVSPPLRDAVAEVENEIIRLRRLLAEIAASRALHFNSHCYAVTVQADLWDRIQGVLES